MDQLYSQFDLSQPAGYRSFLSAQAAAHLAIEDALDAAGAGDVLSDWSERRRGNLVRADLSDLGVVAPAPATPPPFRSGVEVLGGIYVLEGSRLGGASLSSRIAAGAPDRFLAGPSRAGAWRELLIVLNDRLGNPADLQAAAGAARACFRCYEHSAMRELELL